MCLLKRIDIAPEHIPVLNVACCTLHNMCEIHGDKFNSDWYSNDSTDASMSDDHDEDPAPTDIPVMLPMVQQTIYAMLLCNTLRISNVHMIILYVN